MIVRAHRIGFQPSGTGSRTPPYPTLSFTSSAVSASVSGTDFLLRVGRQIPFRQFKVFFGRSVGRFPAAGTDLRVVFAPAVPAATPQRGMGNGEIQPIPLQRSR